MSDLTGLPPEAFGKFDESPDSQFYRLPRLVTHIDAPAIQAVTRLYRTLLPAGSVLLDIMSSWVSHLPEEMRFAEVIGLGMNADELAANPRLTRSFVQDLNLDPQLPLPAESIDGAVICVSVQYLQRPVPVFRDILRVLRPGGRIVVTFSNRCFPTKAIAIWGALDAGGRKRLVGLSLAAAGFDAIEASDPIPEGGPGDPLHAVVGAKDRTGPNPQIETATTEV